jgi:hypothetical protein
MTRRFKYYAILIQREFIKGTAEGAVKFTLTEIHGFRKDEFIYKQQEGLLKELGLVDYETAVATYPDADVTLYKNQDELAQKGLIAFAEFDVIPVDPNKKGVTFQDRYTLRIVHCARQGLPLIAEHISKRMFTDDSNGAQYRVKPGTLRISRRKKNAPKV